MEQATKVWSPDRLKSFRDMCSFHGTLSFVLTGKNLCATYAKGASEKENTYTGSIPHRGLENIPFELFLNDDREYFPDHIGFVRLANLPTFASDAETETEDRAYIYAKIGEPGLDLPEVLGRAIAESGLFNFWIELKMHLDETIHEMKLDDLLEKEIPIKEIRVSTTLACGDTLENDRPPIHTSKVRFPVTTYLSFIGSGIAKLISLVLAAYLFTLMTNKVEIVFFAVLIFIFTQIRWSMAGRLELLAKFHDQYLHVLRLLKDPMLRQPNVAGETGENERIVQKIKIQTYMDMVYLGLLYLLASLMIIGVVIGY